MSDELKPVRCGCGGEVAVLFGVDKGHEYYIVKCWGCGTQTLKKRHKTEAIEAWNKAMGAKDINVPTKERTANVISDDVIITVNGYRYHYEEYLCNTCKNKVIRGDEYCSHCGARLEWNE